MDGFCRLQDQALGRGSVEEDPRSAQIVLENEIEFASLMRMLKLFYPERAAAIRVYDAAIEAAIAPDLLWELQKPRPKRKKSGARPPADPAILSVVQRVANIFGVQWKDQGQGHGHGRLKKECDEDEDEECVWLEVAQFAPSSPPPMKRPRPWSLC